MKRIASAIIILAFGLLMLSPHVPVAAKPEKSPLQVVPPPPPPADQASNPFFKPYGTTFDVPPFDRIKNEHFLPAIKEGISREQAEVEAIINNPAPPTFENTISALDRTGIFLSDVTAVFGALQGANTNRELQALAREVSPMLSAHGDNISLNPRLFERVKTVYDQKEKFSLDQEQIYLLETTYKGFVRSGALLDEVQKEKLRQLNQELSLLSVRFAENLLAETNDFKLVIEDETGLAGLPPSVRNTAAETAKQMEMPGKWVFTLQWPSISPFLTNSERRDLREKLHRAYFMRGDNNNAHDNKEIIQKIIALRSERAKLLGYATHADYVLERNMAKIPQTVDDFLMKLWNPALEVAKKEVKEMQAIIDREGGNFKLASWDWWYYAEKLRQEKYALDDAALRPYFKLDNVRNGIFTLCDKLYGLKFAELPDLPRYNLEVQVFEVREADGSHLGVLYMDFHPRPNKRVGAWSGAFRRAYYDGDKRIPPVSTIVCNFTRPTADTPSLLSLEEVETFFHEFGHSMATLFSQGRYRSRSIARDAVELPSQIMEHWALEPELLAIYAKHYQTGEVIPDELVQKILKSRLFNMGFISVEYLAASILDMAWHTLTPTGPEAINVNDFEKKVLDRIGLIPEIVSRYRTAYFNHIFASGYAAGYYSYIWSEVLDCDAYEAFKEKGIFDEATALSFRKNLLEKFGTEDPLTQYVRFRGAEPRIEPLLRKRGLS